MHSLPDPLHTVLEGMGVTLQYLIGEALVGDVQLYQEAPNVLREGGCGLFAKASLASASYDKVIPESK